MKRLPILALCLFAGTTFAQEPVQKEIKTDVKAVTVYLQGAQETRTAAVDVPAGKTLLKFGDLSPFIDAKSVQVKADGALTILSVNHQQNFLDKPDKPDEQVKLEAKLKGINDQIDLENTALEVIDEDLAFLKENRVMSGKNQALTVLALKEATDFYNNKLTDLKIKSTQHRKTLEELQKQAAEIQGQLNILTNKKEYASGEVLVLVEAKQPVKTTFELVYIVSNAGWNPSYDIRANNINEPIEVVYKANIRQDTKEDWKNVHLKLSSYNPSETGVAPELKTYYLDYNTTPPVYGKSITSVSGRVSDTEGKGVAGVNVTVDGSGISTVTNAQGSYSLTLPANAQQLNFSLIGYIPQTRFISGSVLN
ncbi:MAG: mucoidy inhibitor MuiA family protein, partial [Bacteroidota bacterium]|nr:mucoidy inhibitor MuiA family protein [Bacteroidota bacterium]